MSAASQTPIADVEARRAELATVLACKEKLETAVNEQFAKYDADSSGAIDTRELRVALESVLAMLDAPATLSEKQVRRTLRLYDTNKDGVLQRVEFARFVSDSLENIVATLDAQLLCRRAAAERDATAALIREVAFPTLDADRNERLSLDEVQAGLANVLDAVAAKKSAAASGDGGDGARASVGARPHFSADATRALFTKYDANADGVLDRNEFSKLVFDLMENASDATLGASGGGGDD